MATVQLRAIATQAHVSVKTVANILNPTYRHLYSPTTVQRVLGIAEELGYQPNGSARSLVSKRFAAIGLILSTSAQMSNLPLPLLHGIEEELHAAGLHLVVAALPDERLRDASTLPKILRELMVDGLLVDYNTAIPEVLIQHLARHDRPTVWLNVPLPDNGVRPDDFSASRDMTLALMAAGHRRIAYVDEIFYHLEGQRHYSKDHRLAGFREACPTGTLLLDDATTSLSQRFRDLMHHKNRPTAVVCYGHETTYAIEAAARAGLSLPGDVVIGGFASAGTTEPGPYRLAYAEIPERAVGKIAVATLLKKLTDPTYHPPEIVVPFQQPPAELLRLQ